MATRSDASEPAVDELRRRARRRLVGAIVLALAAAVLLPLLLESEPKPLGDDVSIQIPPIDSGKFINPLSSGKVPDPKVKGTAAGNRSAGESPPPPPSGEGQPTVPPTPNQGSPANPAATSVTPSPAVVAAPATAEESRAAGGKVAASDNSQPVAESQAPARAEAAKTSTAYVVQIAAFSDSYGARALAAKLKRGGFPGYTEAVATDKGTLHRVRVGPYESREAADAALVKLKAAGFSGMIAHVG